MITRSKDDLDVTAGKGIRSSGQLSTGGMPMTEGRHYWEVLITLRFTCRRRLGMMMLGAARPGLDHNDASSHAFSDSAYYICASNGDLFGHGKECDDRQGQFEMGDRIGMLLDLDAGWLRFYTVTGSGAGRATQRG